jgi:hypothetical protein
MNRSVVKHLERLREPLLMTMQAKQEVRRKRLLKLSLKFASWRSRLARGNDLEGTADG